MQKLSVSLEDYIEEIYTQVLKNGHAKVTAIADALAVKKASVTGALNILQEKQCNQEFGTLTLSQRKLVHFKKIIQKGEC